MKYEGDAPRLALLKGWSDKSDWWGMSPDFVDEVNHIAYFTDDSIETRWEHACPELDISEMTRVFVRTADSGSQTPEDAKLTTTIQAIALLHKHSWGDWTDKGERDEGEVVELRTCEDGAAHDGKEACCPAPELKRVVHEWGAWTTVKPSSCGEAGEQRRACKNHPEEVQTRTIPAKGHWWNLSGVVKPARCDEEGLAELVCATCGATTTEVISKLGHNWDGWTLEKEPTCTEAGVEKRTCLTDPSHIERRDSIEHRALGHVDDGGKVARAATEDREGETVHTCTRCGTVLSRTSIPKLSSSGQEKEVIAETAPPARVEQDAIEDAKPAGGGSDATGSAAAAGGGSDATGNASAARGDSSSIERSPSLTGVSAKSGSTALVVDASSNGAVTVTSAKNARGVVNIDKVVTADGRKLKVTAVAAGAFAGSKATKVTLGNSVKKIGKGAFKNSKKLKSVTLGKNVTSIGKGAFKGCKKLKTITLRSSKLTKSSFTNLLAGTKVKLVKLVGMSASVKKKALVKYTKWLPQGVVMK